MDNAAITRFLHSRGGATLAILIMLAGTWFDYHAGRVTYIPGDKGFALPSANDWISSPLTEMIVNLVITGVIIVMSVYINRAFNVLRAMTQLYVVFFAFFELSTPNLLAQLTTSTVLCVVVMACMILLYSCYGDNRRIRRIFLIFFFLSAAAASQYAFVVYIPLFLLGCAQMKIMNLRTIGAALLGIMTPWWILLGFGLVSPADLHIPKVVSIFDAIDLNEAIALVVTVGVTVLLTLSAYMLTLLKSMTYNAKSRSFGSFIAIMTALTIVAMVVDYTNITAYVTLLNFCAAYQLSHFFLLHKSEKSYIAITTILAVYFVLYLWRTII